MNEIEFYDELKKIGINLSENQKEQFKKYYTYLIEYNSHTNLTSITNKEDVYLKHFYDSILLSKAVKLENIETLLDIGSGAGFPGIVIKIIYPHIKLTLLDSNNKKTTFCKEVVSLLNLNDVLIVNDRAEKYITKKREYYDLVTARAVKQLPILSELAIPYVKVNGLFIAMKSNIDNELEESLNGIKKLNAEYIETKKFDLPKNAGLRTFIIIKKIKPSNTIYPREYNKIIKKHL